jgi:hypothetical protein
MAKSKAEPTLHLFIDTSAFLKFYAFTNDDLEELKKVVGLLKGTKLKLYVPAQVRDEFQRNREGKLAASLDAFSKVSIPRSIPRFMANYEEAAAFNEAAKGLEQARSALINKAREDAAKGCLAADEAFDQIIKAAGVIVPDQKVINAANMRRIIGNPPGKKDSLGDQINWETILAHVPEGTELHIVADDGDYRSPLNDKMAHQFLIEEWKQKKDSKLHVHRELRPLLNEKFPNIKLAVDIEKTNAMEALIYSGSFYDTHSAIASLTEFKEELSWNDAKDIFDAGLANNQIGWIGTDNDVNQFYRHLMAKYDENLDFVTLVELGEKFPDLTVLDDEPPPF